MTDSTVRAPAIKSFRTLSGLGDAVYAAPIVGYFAQLAPVHVETKYSEVFQFIKGVQTSTIRAAWPNTIALRYQPHPGHNYYADYCRSAGVDMLPFHLPWENDEGMEKLFDGYHRYHRGGRQICLIKEPSAAHMHRDRDDFSITPNSMEMQRWMLDNRNKFYYVSVEHETNNVKSRLVGIDAKISGLNTVEYISLCNIAHHVATQIGHLCPLAQALGKPLTIFKPEQENRAGFLKHLTPEMVIVPEQYASAPVEVI